MPAESNKHGISAREGVGRQPPEERRRVDDDVIIVRCDRTEDIFQERAVFREAHHALFRLLRRDVRGNEVEERNLVR